MKLLVSALEPSSNLHLKEVMKHTQDVELVGIFDKSLGEPLYDISQMAVIAAAAAMQSVTGRIMGGSFFKKRLA